MGKKPQNYPDIPNEGIPIDADPDFIEVIPRHQRFIKLLLAGKNCTEAYMIIHPSSKRSVAGVRGWELKNKYAHILQRQTPLPTIALERVASRTLDNLANMAFADPLDLLDQNGNPRDLRTIPKHLRLAISEVEIGANGDVKFKFNTKLRALEILAKAAKITDDRPPVEINIMSEEQKAKEIQDILVKAVARKELQNKSGNEGDKE